MIDRLTVSFDKNKMESILTCYKGKKETTVNIFLETREVLYLRQQIATILLKDNFSIKNRSLDDLHIEVKGTICICDKLVYGKMVLKYDELVFTAKKGCIKYSFSFLELDPKLEHNDTVKLNQYNDLWIYAKIADDLKTHFNQYLKRDTDKSFTVKL